MSANSSTSARGGTFGVTYRKNGQVIELECDASRVDEIWRRIEDEFSDRLTPDDLARWVKHVKQYPLPEPRA